MGNGDHKDGDIRCACCGSKGGEVDGAGVSEWLRQDVILGLGVCSRCTEWLEAWDRGHREVGLESHGSEADSRPIFDIEQIIQGARLPSFSSVLLEIYDLLSDDRAGADQIAILLESDAALTARTLQLANSAFYGSAREIATVKEALILIGPSDLWWLLFTTEVKSLFYGIDQRLMDMEKFWRHSLMVAAVSRVLSERYRIGHSREMFVAGLLHDLGKLLLLQQKPIEYGALLMQEQQGATLVEVEQATLGFTHAEAGSRLLARWQLPERLVQLVGSHHLSTLQQQQEESLIAKANQLVHRLEEQTDPLIDDEQLIAEESLRIFQRLAKLVLT